MISKINEAAFQCVLPHLVAVMHGGDYLPKEMSSLPLTQAPAFTDVVVQLTLAGILHHDYNLVLVLEHCVKRTEQLESVHISFQINKSKPMEGNRRKPRIPILTRWKESCCAKTKNRAHQMTPPPHPPHPLLF